MKYFLPFLFISFCSLLCLLLGGYMIFHGDFFFLADQARDMMLTQDMILRHKIALIGSHSGIGGFFHGPLWLYILAVFYVLGQGNPFFFTTLYMLVPVIGIIVSFFVATKLYNQKTGFVVSFLLAIHTLSWTYIPITISISLFPVITSLFLYFSVVFLRGKKEAFFGMCFFAGLAFQLETAAAIALAPVPLIIFVLFLPKLQRLRTFLFGVLGYILSLSTFILFDLRHQFLHVVSLLRIFEQTGGKKDYVNFLHQFMDHLMSLKNTFLSVAFSDHHSLQVLATIIFGYGIYLLWTKQKKQEMKEVGLYLLLPLFAFTVYIPYPHPIFGEYVFDLMVSVLFGFSFLLVFIWQTQLGKILTSLFLSMSLFIVCQYLFLLYAHPYQQNLTSGSYHNQKQVVSWIMQDAKGAPFGYFVYTPEIFTYGMDYLFSYERKLHPTLSITNEKRNPTYLILYPHLENDKGAYTFWKTNTIHTNAKILVEKKFPGDIVVQKLDLSRDTQPVAETYHQQLIFR